MESGVSCVVRLLRSFAKVKAIDGYFNGNNLNNGTNFLTPVSQLLSSYNNFKSKHYYVKVVGQTNAVVGIVESTISENKPCILTKFLKPLAFNIEAAIVER